MRKMKSKRMMRMLVHLKHPISPIFPARQAVSRENQSAQPAQPVLNLSPRHSHGQREERRTFNYVVGTNGTTTAKTWIVPIVKRSDHTFLLL